MLETIHISHHTIESGGSKHWRENMPEAEDQWPNFHEAIEIWEHFYMAHNVVARNTEELINFFRKICLPGEISMKYLEAVTSGNPRNDFKDSIDLEVNRLILNYLTSIATLVDMTRNTMKHYAGSAPEIEYQKRISSIRNHGLSPFMIRLRSHVVHRARLPWHIKIHLGQHEKLLDVVLNRDVLLSYKDTSGDARNFLESLEENVPFINLVTQYGLEIETLNKWLWKQLGVLYSVPHLSE